MHRNRRGRCGAVVVACMPWLIRARALTVARLVQAALLATHVAHLRAHVLAAVACLKAAAAGVL